MRLTIRTNSDQLVRQLGDVARRQIPFAMSKALNQTALDVQKAQRARMGQSFTLRRRPWAERSVKIGKGDRATKQKLVAKVRIETPGDPSRSDILTKFEDGGTKRAKDGGRIAVPKETRISKSDNHRRNRRPKAFDFTHAGGMVWRGKFRTFMIRRPDGTGGIYQRTGRGRGRGARHLASSIATRSVRDVRVKTLYRFTPDAKIDDRLKFEQTADKTVHAVFQRNFRTEFVNAVRTAR